MRPKLKLNCGRRFIILMVEIAIGDARVDLMADQHIATMKYK